MWDLPLNSLRAFAAIYSTGGIRAAARKLGVAHSSVSRHLAELESWLGVRLTLKGIGRRPLRFTSQGRSLGEAALASQRQLADAVSALKEARSADSVLVGTNASFAVRWLLPRLPEFEASHPGIEVSVIVDRSLVDLENIDLDLALRMGEPRRPGPGWQKLMGDELYPVMSPSFWERHGRPSSPSDLIGLRLLHDRDPQASWDAWKRAHGPAKLDTRKGPRFTSTDLVLRAATNGQGVALARHQLAAADVSTGQLLRPFGDLGVVLENSYWMGVPRHFVPKRATRSLINWLERTN